MPNYNDYIIEIAEFQFEGIVYKIGDYVEFEKKIFAKTILISSIFKNFRGEIYLGMRNPNTNEYFGNSDAINETNRIRMTKEVHILKMLRMKKIEKLDLI
jgi:hypothetical protein